MKLLRFDAGQGPRLGALLDEQVIDLTKAAELAGECEPVTSGATPWYSSDLNGLIAAGDEGLRRATAALKCAANNLGKSPSGLAYAPKDVRWLPPVVNPSKIIAVGQNYMDHVREQKIDPPKTPILFSKAPTSLIGPGDEIRWPAGITTQADPEVELGVVIGRTTKGILDADALGYIFGYTILNDVSARDLQFGDVQWVRGKSLDTFCPVGPVVVTADEIPNPQNLNLSCAVNGRTWQNSNTQEMIFSVAALISFIARGISLKPGDLVATGTPNGVGFFQNPQAFLKPGDRLRLEVEGIGVLENSVGPTY